MSGQGPGRPVGSRSGSDTQPTTGTGMEPGTKRRAIVVGIIIAGALGGVSWLIGSNRTRTAVEDYISQGETAGAAALSRDIAQWSRIGADPGPAVQRLTALGFSCNAPAAVSGTWSCVVRVPERARRLTTLEANLRTDGGVLSGITTRIFVQNMQ